MDFATLKKNRSSAFENLIKETKKLSDTGSKNSDDRFWQPEVDKAGNGFASIRFLPAAKGEDVPWVRIFNHGFQGPTGLWYIENSLTTLDQKDPVSEVNSKLWNTGTEANKDKARKQKRKLTFISNILVVKDPANPKNEGKVFLYKFGKKIFDKLNDVMHPQYEDEKPINPFDFWEGANFKIKIRMVEGYRNYDKSEFETPAPLFDNDSKLEAVYDGQHSLKAFLAPSNFKSYDTLKAKLDNVLGLSNNPNAPSIPATDIDEEFEAPRTPKEAGAPWKETVEASDDLDYFKKMLA